MNDLDMSWTIANSKFRMPTNGSQPSMSTSLEYRRSSRCNIPQVSFTCTGAIIRIVNSKSATFNVLHGKHEQNID